MRTTVLTTLAFIVVSAPAQARCAPGAHGTVIARTPAGAVAYQTPRERIFACRRGGEPVRIGTVPFAATAGAERSATGSARGANGAA